MAKFRTSSSVPLDGAVSLPGAANAAALHDRSIGDLIRQAKDLTAEQVESILLYQREKGVRFGEAAIALGLASERDVLYALSQQFHYPFAPEENASRFSDELVVASQPFSQQAEAFRGIRAQLMMKLFNGEAQRCALAVVSPESGDGKTFFAANLAVALSQLGGRTLLVDADLRGPRQHSIFGLENSSGLSGVLSGRAEANVIQQVRDLPSLYVLPVGNVPPNPVELFQRPAFGLLIKELMSKFDYVVVDTPAAIYGADASVIAAKCGAALILARKDASRLGALQDLVSHLSDNQTKVAGVIVNDY